MKTTMLITTALMALNACAMQPIEPCEETDIAEFGCRDGGQDATNSPPDRGRDDHDEPDGKDEPDDNGHDDY